MTAAGGVRLTRSVWRMPARGWAGVKGIHFRARKAASEAGLAEREEVVDSQVAELRRPMVENLRRGGRTAELKGLREEERPQRWFVRRSRATLPRWVKLPGE